MFHSHVFWRLSLSMTVFTLMTVLAWGVVCGTPPSDQDAVAIVTWRWRCAVMGIGTLGASLIVARILMRPLAEQLGTLDRVARRLADSHDQREPSWDADGDDSTTDGFQNVGQQVEARIANLQTEQNRLVQNHNRLAIVLEAMVEGVIAVDREQRILWANSAALKMLNLKPDRISEHPLESVRLPKLQELVKASIAGQTTSSLEFAVPWTNFTLEAVVSRLPGRPCPGAVVVLHDVTDLRRLENLRREFVTNVSHELKTPLASISAYAETLLDGALDDPAVNRGFVTRIDEQANRLSKLILELLELGRVETENHAFDIDPVNVGNIVQASVQEHMNVARSKGLSLIASPSAIPVWGFADTGGLRTIVDNLIDNAINYTSQKGEVGVRWWREGEQVCIEVRDTGVGIAKEHQARIFERFFRVDRARSREVGGTGLGLSIVKHLCQVFGGDIQVRSRLGHGSTFTVKLRGAEPVAK